MGNWLDRIASGTATPQSGGLQHEADQWWRYARQVATAFRENTELPTIQVFGPVLLDGECAFFQATANYSRMYGGDGSYTTTGLVALGSPAFMVGSLAASGYINHRRKTRAQRDAAQRWRDHQRAGLIVTSDRLLVNTSESGWLSFYYGAVSEYYPDLTNRSLTLAFGGQCSPLCLQGPPAPAAAVVVGAAIAPQRWAQDPRIGPLWR